MNARIVVQSGISAGAAHWIEKNVVRIGSDTASDMVIPSTALEAHALTVECRQSGYQAYNRGQQPIFVGGQLVQPGAHAKWSDTDLLELADGVTLALELDIEPTQPASRASATGSVDHRSATQHVPSELTKATSANATSATPSKYALQLGVIGVCVLGCVLLLVRDQLRGEEASAARAPKFDTVIRSLLDSESSFADNLVERLQVAEAAFVRDQREMARQHYRRLRDSVTLADTTDESSMLARQLTERLTEHRLRQLGQ